MEDFFLSFFFLWNVFPFFQCFFLFFLRNLLCLLFVMKICNVILKGVSHQKQQWWTLIKMMVQINESTNDTWVTLAKMCFSNPVRGVLTFTAKILKVNLMHKLICRKKNYKKKKRKITSSGCGKGTCHELFTLKGTLTQFHLCGHLT